MSQPAVKWKDLKKYFIRHGYEIMHKGGDAMIKAPKENHRATPRSRNVIRIGHKSSNKPGSEVLPCYLRNIENAFGITRKDIRDG